MINISQDSFDKLTTIPIDEIFRFLENAGLVKELTPVELNGGETVSVRSMAEDVEEIDGIPYATGDKQLSLSHVDVRKPHKLFVVDSMLCTEKGSE